MDENTVEIEVPNKFFRDWVMENYMGLIKDALHQATKRAYSLSILIKENQEIKTDNDQVRK